MTVTDEVKSEHDRVIKEVLEGVREIFAEQNKTIKELKDGQLELKEELRALKQD